MRCAAQIILPWADPLDVLGAFADEAWALGLVSGGGGEAGRWSYLARAPAASLTIRADDPREPFAALADLLGPHGARLADGPPFQGGLAGLAAYELGDRVERLGLPRAEPWPDLAVGLYPAVLAFDHALRRVHAVGRGDDATSAQAKAREAAAWLSARAGPPRRGSSSGPISAASGPDYEAAVAKVVGRIHAGDLFQANIARAWRGRLEGVAAPFNLFAELVASSPAPFAGYLRLEGLAVVSNSPERFLRAGPGAEASVETRPIKGTRPRGSDPAQDAALARELAASLKDRAENLMIVDLMRNDLARACAAGSVAVPSLFALESFANVHHLVSTVTGRLAPGRSAADLLRAAFPPGSVTGAPKVQAMKMIAALEPPRGPYCGSLFWMGADGAMDSSVLIRTAACVQDGGGWRIEARAGAGIVADSDPAGERAETEAKISAVMRALEGKRDEAAA